jgi:hypothetical protein
MSIVSNSAIVSQVLPSVITGITNLGVIITSAFFGGLFAGVWTNHFESKRRINDKRRNE